jgi:hypothetical protein
LVTRRRCQRRIVPGVTRQCPAAFVAASGRTRRRPLDPPSPDEGLPTIMPWRPSTPITQAKGAGRHLEPHRDGFARLGTPAVSCWPRRSAVESPTPSSSRSPIRWLVTQLGYQTDRCSAPYHRQEAASAAVPGCLACQGGPSGQAATKAALR